MKPINNKIHIFSLRVRNNLLTDKVYKVPIAPQAVLHAYRYGNIITEYETN